MTGLWSRRRVLGTILATGVSLTAVRSYAQEGDVLRGQFDAEGTYWQPVVTALYAAREQGIPSFPEGDGPPVFPDPETADGAGPPPPEEAARRGLVHLSLNAPPADRAPTIDTDWVLYDARRQRDEHASAIVAAREHGKRRLWLHRCREEEYLAVYPVNTRLYLFIGADVGRERFPIPGRPVGAAREALIREKVRIVNGRLAAQYLDNVRPNGAGGVEKSEVLNVSLTNLSLAGLAERSRIEFIPRMDTAADASGQLNSVLRLLLELELEAGPELGPIEPRRQKISAEIRIAIGEQYLEILKIFGAGERK